MKIKILNIFSWLLVLGVIMYAIKGIGNSTDTRTSVIIVDGSKDSLSGINDNEIFDSGDNFSSNDKLKPDYESDSLTDGKRREYPKTVQLNDSAAFYLSVDNPQKAANLLIQALAIDSNYARAHYNLGIAYQKINKLNEAIKEYKQAFKLRPHYFEPAYNLGRLFSTLKDNDNAILWLEKAVEIGGSRRSTAHYNLGIVYRRIGEIDKSEFNYREALRLKPDNIEARFNLALLLKNENRYKTASEEFEKVASLGYRPAKLYRNLGICYSNLGKNEKALDAYSRWAELDLLDGNAWYNLAIIQTRLQDTVSAIASYKKTLEKDTSHYRAAYNLGLMFYNLGELDSSAYYYRKSTEINRNYSKAFYNLALIYSKKDQYDSAAILYSKVVELDPENQKALYNLALSFTKANDIESAIVYYRQLIDIDPVNTKSLNNLGTAYLEIKEYDSALVYFNRLVGLTKSAKAYFNRAKTYHRLDSLELSKRDYREAIKQNNKYTSAYHNLAILENKSGNSQEAIKLLLEGLKYAPSNWKSHWKLGQIYLSVGETENAKEHYQKAFLENPNSEKFKREYNDLLKQENKE